MSGEIIIRERVSENKCYILTDTSSKELKDLEDWLETHTHGWAEVTLEVIGYHTKDKDTITKTLHIRSEESFGCDYPDKIKIELSGEPLYVIASNHNINLMYQKKFDEEYEIIEETTK